MVKLSEQIGPGDHFMKPLQLFFLSRLSVVFNRDVGVDEELPLYQTPLLSPDNRSAEGIELQEKSAKGSRIIQNG